MGAVEDGIIGISAAVPDSFGDCFGDGFCLVVLILRTDPADFVSVGSICPERFVLSAEVVADHGVRGTENPLG